MILDNILIYLFFIQLVIVFFLCLGVCVECFYLIKLKYMYEVGDVIIGGVFGLYSVNEMYFILCGSINVDNGV